MSEATRRAPDFGAFGGLDVGVPRSRKDKGTGIVPVDGLLTDDGYLDAMSSLQPKDKKVGGSTPELKEAPNRWEQELQDLKIAHPTGSTIELRSDPPKSATVFGHKLIDQASQRFAVLVIKDRGEKMAYVTSDGALIRWGMQWEEPTE